MKELTRYWVYALFSFKGRISRRWFWFWTVSSAAVLICAGLGVLQRWLYLHIGFIQRINTITYIISWVIFLYILYTTVAVCIKRLADTNRKKWEVVLALIPVIDWFCFGIGAEQLLIGGSIPIMSNYINLGIDRFSIGVVGTVILYLLSPFCIVYISIVCGFLTTEPSTKTDQRNWGKFFKRLLLVSSIIAFCVVFVITAAIGNNYAIGFGFWSVWLVWGIYGVIRWIYNGLRN